MFSSYKILVEHCLFISLGIDMGTMKQFIGKQLHLSSFSDPCFYLKEMNVSECC